MSASRERKLRQKPDAASVSEKSEKAKKEQKQAKTLKLQTTIFVVVCVLMVAVLIGYGIVSTGIVERSTTALTVGEHKITAAEMNYFFVTEAYDYYNQNSSLMKYFISSSAPLNQQVLNQDTGYTWADQFMEAAVTKARDTYAMYDKALADGYELDEDTLSSIGTAVDALSTYASLKGLSSANAYLKSIYGRGCTTENYRHFLTVQQTAAGYASDHNDNITWTEQELADYEAKDPMKYNSYSFRYYFIAVNDYYDSDSTDEEKAAAQDTAKDEADKMLAASTTEDAFVAAANEIETRTAKTTDATSTTEDSSSTYDASTATLYTDVLRDNVNTTIADWVTDESRKAGDTASIPSYSTVDGQEDTLIGYYVTMFLGANDNTQVFTKDVRHILVADTSESGESKAAELLAEFEENPTEEHFAEMAEENSEDTGSKSNGGLYEAVTPGQMVDTFNSWLFKEDHKAGDYGIIKTDYGYHLMYMVGDNISYRQSMIESDYRTSVYTDWYTEVTEAYTAERKGGMSWVNTAIYLNTSSSSSSN